jgi:hypothetical protein
MVAGWNPFLFLKHRFHILHFPKSVDFPHNQPAAIKVGVPISARVLKLTPRVIGTYLGALTWVYKITYQGAFTVHNTANISLAASGRF